jgi:pimeloyl-ACP methyl ester carboxylesterase
VPNAIREKVSIVKQTQYLDRPEGRIAYDDSGGSGPLVVCVPGMGDVRAVYRLLAPALGQEGYRVITTDVRGHGESSIGWTDYSAAAVGTDLVALIRHVDAGPAHIVGGSMAAASAVWAAAEDPSAVAALVLLGPVVRDHSMNPLLVLTFKALLRSPAGWGWWYTRLYPSAPPADLKAYVAALKRMLREPGRLSALRSMAFASKQSCTARLGDVRAPALIVMGTKDPDVPDPRAEAHWLAAELGTEPLILEGIGHYPQVERPETTTPAVLSFLREVDSRVA